MSSYSESTQILGSIGYCVPSYGSVSDFRLETEQSAMSLTGYSPRKSETASKLGAPKSERSTNYPVDPTLGVDSENERNVGRNLLRKSEVRTDRTGPISEPGI